jgi:hypothetical protein
MQIRCIEGVVLGTYVKPPSLRLDWVYCGCDKLIMLCLKAGFNGRFELSSEYADWGPCPLATWVVGEAPGEISRHVYILARGRPWTHSGTGASAASINDLR